MPFMSKANRAVTTTRKSFPSFTPADLPAVREASERALRLANAALAAAPTSDLAKKELAYAQAAQHRYEAGPEPDVQAAAEIEYGIALRDIGHSWKDSHALAMAAEAFMNYSPWDYQLVWPTQPQALSKHLEVPCPFAYSFFEIFMGHPWQLH
ncbi:hypothetical protein WJX84_005215 [Apatococcus fuscideae]|uniref:Uncharacterized protein n=1 Tax=Apatococcus fuscideae TaxID=2026836 RepID=A0AAW1SPH1_9CHLO